MTGRIGAKGAEKHDHADRQAASAKVKGILEQEKESLPQGGLRIYVQGGGCSGFQYGMVLDEVADGDQVIELEGVKVIVDPMSLRYLEGAEVDYKEDLMGGGFAIKNPNAKSTCGCGHSFQAGRGRGRGSGRGRPPALTRHALAIRPGQGDFSGPARVSRA